MDTECNTGWNIEQLRITDQDIMQSTFEATLAVVLAHTVLLESKGPEPFGECWAVNGGDPPAPTAAESTGEMMQALEKYLPGYMKTLRSEIVPTEKAQLEGAQAVSKPYADLTADIYDTTGRRMNTIGEEIAASNQLAKARSDAEVLAGPGKDIIRSADEAQRIIDPEFYKMKEATGRVGTGIINSFGDDPSKLSGSEREEVGRGLAWSNLSSGNTGPSNINAVSNAMTFGDASNRRRTNAAQTIGALAPSMTATRSGVDVLQQALGRPGQVNTGNALVTGAREAGANAFGQGQALMSQTGENQRAAMNVNANRRSSLDTALGGISSITGSVGNCCFIFLECHNGTLPWYVRLCRDHYYEQEPRVAEGYKRMAKWLVPLMRKNSCIKHVVNALMVKPITRYGAYLCNEASYSLRGHIAKLAWFAVWRLTAR